MMFTVRCHRNVTQTATYRVDAGTEAEAVAKAEVVNKASLLTWQGCPESIGYNFKGCLGGKMNLKELPNTPDPLSGETVDIFDYGDNSPVNLGKGVIMSAGKKNVRINFQGHPRCFDLEYGRVDGYAWPVKAWRLERHDLNRIRSSLGIRA